MGIFNRLFKIGQAEAHSVIEKLEDPIKLTEQGIRDLKTDLDKSLRAFAEVKALSIKSKREATDARNSAKAYEEKAMALIQKAEKGSISAEDADRLASEALVKKQEAEQAAMSAEKNAEVVENNLMQLDGNIKKLKSNIAHYENELKTLKARAKVSQATTKLNKQMAQIDGTGTISMLEKMKTKVNEQEALAEAYGEVANSNKSVDEEIDDALGKGAKPEVSDALAALKAKMKGGQSQE